eukprot:SAG31_NODE_7341_length_1714_cov_4.182663_2_plen_160_part_00
MALAPVPKKEEKPKNKLDLRYASAPPARGRSTATDNQEVQNFKTFCEMLANVPGLAHITVVLVRAPMDETGNSSRGKNDLADNPANIDPTESGAPMAICDQVEPVLTKPMMAVNTYSSRTTPDLVASHLKVATQFVGALSLIMLISTFALGMIAVVRIL